MNRIVLALIVALVLSGCNVDAHAPAANAAEPAQSAYQAGFYWSELGTYTVYDGNVEMYD